MSEVNEMKSLTLNGTKYDSFPDREARAAAAAKLPGPTSAVVGQYLVVEEVDTDGKITKVKTVEAPTGGSGQNPTQAVAIDYDLTVHSVNHRGYSATAPENTIPAYIKSKEMGFTYVECDVSFTSDGVAVLLHDSTIDRTSNGSGSISAMTYAEASKYDYGSWKSSAYTGTRIPTFEEFIILCKRIGLHPYIELKSNGGYTENQIAGIVATVEAVGMKGKVTYISFNITYLRYVKTADPSARLGYVVDAVTSTVINTATGLKLDTNEVFVDCNYANVTAAVVELCASADLPLEVWTANSESWIADMNPYITGVTSDSLIAGKILYNAGMVYEYGIDSENVHAHSYTAAVTTAATCTTAGVKTFTCECGDSYTESIPATGHNYVDGICSVCGAADPSYSEDVTLTSILAAYNGGDVAVGTAVTDLTGIVVTAIYSDDSTEPVSSYTLSGEIAEGENTITVTYKGMTATFTVTGFVAQPLAYTVTNTLINTVNSNTAETVEDGNGYSATLTGADGYDLPDNSVTVTMGGIDITQTVFTGGVVNIAIVTGDIVIEAESFQSAPAVPDGFELVAKRYSNDITYGVSNVGRAPTGEAGSTIPYTTPRADRASYVKTDIPVEYGYVYRYDFVATDATSQIGTQYLSEAGLEHRAQGTAYEGCLDDPGWQENGVEYTVLEYIEESPIACVMLAFRRNTSNSAFVGGEIQSVTISRKPV